MNKSVFVAFAAAVALCGCQRDTGNQQATNASGPNDTGDTPITLVGCLVPGGAGPQTGAVGTAGNTAPVAYTLIDVTTTKNPSDVGATPGTPATPATSGTAAEGAPRAPATGSGASVDTAIPRSYSLVGEKSQGDLQKYQNSKVEVTGVLVASTDTGAGVPDAGAASAPTGTPATNVERVRVDKVRQLEKTCSGANQNR